MKCLGPQAMGQPCWRGTGGRRLALFPPTSSSYQSHLVRTRILADIPLGVCFNVRCYLSSQMMDLYGHTTRSKALPAQSERCPVDKVPPFWLCLCLTLQDRSLCCRKGS